MATESNSQALTVVNAELAANFIPIFTTETALQRYQAFKDFVKGVLKEGIDFGKNPGSDRDTLLKPGAEKLCTFFGLTPEYIYEEKIEDWTGEKYGQPLFFYRLKCKLFRGTFKVGEGLGACTSWEAKYRYRWADENTVARMGIEKTGLKTRSGSFSEFEFAINKAETTGQYGKPAEYWAKWKAAIADGKARKINKLKKDGTTSPAYEMDMTQYQVPNTDFADIINTVLKIALKRAYVSATLSATNASDYFTQDLEDYIEAEPVPSGPSGSHLSSHTVTSAAFRHEPVASSSPQPPIENRESVGESLQTNRAEAEEGGATHAFSSPTETAAFKGNKTVPEELQSIWRQMFQPEGRLKAFDKFRMDLIQALGEEEGTRKFYAVLNRHNAKEPRDFNKDLSAARRAAKDFYELIELLIDKQLAAEQAVA